MNNSTKLTIDEMLAINGDGWLDIANGICLGLATGGAITAGAAYFGIIAISVSATGGVALAALGLGCVGLGIYNYYE